MRYLFLFLFIAIVGSAFAIETELVVDTAQPRATLTQIEIEQGGCLDLRIVVRENGRLFKSMSTNDIFIFQYATNRITGAWSVWQNTSMNTMAASVLIPVGPVIPAGTFTYEVYCQRGQLKYPLGSGFLSIVATAGYGASVEGLYRIMLNTDLIEQTGSNRLARLSDLSAAQVETNAYLTADFGTNGWWTPYIVTNGVRSLLQ